LQWREVPDPVPGPGEVAIRIGLTSVNFADTQARRGVGAALAKIPFTPGIDAMGTIAALGPGVTDRYVGQRVACNPQSGSYAEIAVAPVALTYPMDPAIPDEAAASGTVLVTAYNILTLAGRLQPGESVLVHTAAGGVGSVAVQMAKQLGAGRIVATAGGPEKVALCRELGADVAIDYRNEDFAAAVKRETGGVDVILDAIGGGIFEVGFPLLAPFGRYVIYGQASDAPANARVDGLHRGNRTIVGYSSGHYRRTRPAVLAPSVAAAYDLVAKRAIRILEGGRFPLRDAAAAHRLVESRATTGRVFLTV